MTRKELNLAVFEGKAERVLWQPRLETWIGHHMQHGTMPERFKGMSSFDIYDALGCSVRYAASVGIESYIDREDLVHITEQHADHTVERYRTPAGEITTVYRDIWDGGVRQNHRIEEFPVKTIADLRVFTDLIERQQYRAIEQAFRRAAAALGCRAEPTIFLSSSGFTHLIKRGAGLVDTYYLLHDHEAEVEAYLEAC